MIDVVSPEVRSRMMSGIKGKNTRPEVLIRKLLFSRGWRYRLHYKGLPGKPDLVFPRLKAAVFINGCFWHVHHCHLFRMPSSRVEFWSAKLERNRLRDAEVRDMLAELGWRHLTIWECALKGKMRLPIEEVANRTSEWLLQGVGSAEIEGMNSGTG